MRRGRLLAALGLAGLMALARADEGVSVCYNYGCAAQADVVFSEVRLGEIRRLLALAKGPEQERALLAQAVGRLYGWAGEQSLVRNDKGGNYPDGEVEGRMDCIDHSTTTTRFLKLLERRGMINWHRVLEPVRRTRVVLFQHFSAVIEELTEPRRAPATPRVPDHVPLMLAMCNCQWVVGDVPLPPRREGAITGARFVVDSWFVDNGKAAVVLPLQSWLDGEGLDVD